MPAARVTVVIPTYDGWELLRTMLPSVLAQTFADLRVVVVDDGSTDGTPEKLAAAFPAVDVVGHERNRGVTAAFRTGTDAVDGELFLLLNNDVELTPGYVAHLVVELDRHPEAACAVGKLRRYAERERIDAAGDAVLPSGAALNRGAGAIDRGQYDAGEEVFSACGGAVLYRMAAFRDVGGFDADFVAYLEDVDWSFRARLRGWTVRYVPQALAFHVGHATSAQRRAHHATLQRRNHLLVVLKNYPGPTLLRFGALVLAYQAAWFLGSVRDGLAGAHLRAWADVVRALPATLRKRRAVQAARRAEPTEIERLLRAGLPPGGPVVRLALQLAPELTARRLAGAER